MPDDSNNPQKQPINVFAYVIGGASFIPCVGIPFALAAIIWGIVKGARGVIILGCLGLAFNVASYGGLFYFGFYQRGGMYDKLRAQMAVTMLNSTVKEIEYYKIQHGSYPKSLEDIDSQEKYSFNNTFDPTAMERGANMDQHFYYQLDPSGKFYYLRSVGPDGIPFTADDLLPSIPSSETQNTGLRLEKPSGTPPTKPDNAGH